MNPYRNSDPPSEVEPAGTSDLGLAGLFLATGLLPLTWTIAQHRVWGAEPSLGLLMVVASAVALVSGRRR
ncbi:MAG: hypothetical protein R3A52_09620 [Polyangiales bacterium]